MCNTCPCLLCECCGRGEIYPPPAGYLNTPYYRRINPLMAYPALQRIWLKGEPFGHKKNEVPDGYPMIFDFSGRGERIWTSDPLDPIQVRYQTALRPDWPRQVARPIGPVNTWWALPKGFNGSLKNSPVLTVWTAIFGHQKAQVIVGFDAVTKCFYRLVYIFDKWLKGFLMVGP